MKKFLILFAVAYSFLFSNLLYGSPFNEGRFVDESRDGSVAVSNTSGNNSVESKNTSSNEKIQKSDNKNDSTKRNLTPEELIQREVIYKIRGGYYRVF